MIKLNNWIYDITASEFERKELKKAIEELAIIEDDDLYNILDEAKNAIDNQDEKALLQLDLWELDINLEQVNQDDFIVYALKNAGYQVDTSNISNSIYAINDEGIKIRISDHKRPDIVEGNVSIYEHDQGMIVNNIEVNSNRIIAAGFSKLEKNKIFYLWK